MKYLLIISMLFLFSGCNAQKKQFHAQNTRTKFSFTIYTPGVAATTCIAVGSTLTVFLVHTYPQIGDYVYTSRSDSIIYSGNGNWYYVNGWSIYIKINSLGVVTDLFAC